MMHVWSHPISVKSDMEKKASPCVQAYGSFCDSWSLTLLRDGLDSNSWSDCEDNGACFNIGKTPKMTIDSQINPISHLKDV